MSSLRLLTGLMAVMAIASSAGAFVSGFPEKVAVGSENAEFSFFVENTAKARQPLTVQFNLPTNYKVMNKPEWVEGGQMEKITVKIYNEKGFENSTYLGKATLNLGGSTAEKNIAVSYAKAGVCGIEAKALMVGRERISVSLENNSKEKKAVTLLETKAMPSGILLEGKRSVELGAFEKKSIELGMRGGSAFKGETELQFDCAGETKSVKAEIDYKPKEALSGLALLGDMTAQGDMEFVINALLVIIAAVLLIAFIARLVRILNTKK